MTDFFFDDFIERIKEFQRQQVEEREKILAEAITKYDFIVGSEDLKETLETALPEGANIIYSPYIKDLTSVYAIKKFDLMDYFSCDDIVTKIRNGVPREDLGFPVSAEYYNAVLITVNPQESEEI